MSKQIDIDVIQAKVKATKAHINQTDGHIRARKTTQLLILMTQYVEDLLECVGAEFDGDWDTAILDFIEKQGVPNLGWIAHPSHKGDGYRVHQTVTIVGQRDWSFPEGYVTQPTAREAVQQAMKLEAEKRLKGNGQEGE